MQVNFTDAGTIETVAERRYHRHPDFLLYPLDPRDIIDGQITADGYLTEQVANVGNMREHCPHCENVALQLVLRHRQVKRTHLFCPHCTRCYDAVYPDGQSALLFAAFNLGE